MRGRQRELFCQDVELAQGRCVTDGASLSNLIILVDMQTLKQ